MMPNSLRYFSLLVVALLSFGGCTLLGQMQPDKAAPAPKAASATVPPTQPVCAGKPLRKVLVTAFPLRYPEQIKSGEFIDWAPVTAVELTRRLSRAGRVRAVAAAERFPFADAEAAPIPERNIEGVPLLTQWAAHEQAQYVLAGVFRDFGKGKKLFVVPERQLVIEAFLYDGIRGGLLARKEFDTVLTLAEALPKRMAPGTREFDASRLGEKYNQLLADIGRWAEDTLACQPFMTRVKKVAGQRLQIDADGDSGIVAGMTLSVTPEPAPRPTSTSLSNPPPQPPHVIEIKPNYSIAEIPAQRYPPKFAVGDVLYIPAVSAGNKP